MSPKTDGGSGDRETDAPAADELAAEAARIADGLAEQGHTATGKARKLADEIEDTPIEPADRGELAGLSEELRDALREEGHTLSGAAAGLREDLADRLIEDWEWGEDCPVCGHYKFVLTEERSDEIWTDDSGETRVGDTVHVEPERLECASCWTVVAAGEGLPDF